jgi:hypothetical protein
VTAPVIPGSMAYKVRQSSNPYGIFWSISILSIYFSCGSASSPTLTWSLPSSIQPTVGKLLFIYGLYDHFRFRGFSFIFTILCLTKCEVNPQNDTSSNFPGDDVTWWNSIHAALKPQCRHVGGSSSPAPPKA